MCHLHVPGPLKDAERWERNLSATKKVKQYRWLVKFRNIFLKFNLFVVVTRYQSASIKPVRDSCAVTRSERQNFHVSPDFIDTYHGITCMYIVYGIF